MTIDPRVAQIVETALRGGLTAEQACQDWPELLPDVRRELAICQDLAAVIDAMFPAHADSTARITDGTRDSAADEDEEHAVHANLVQGDDAIAVGEPLPKIPGYRLEGIIGRGGMGVVYRAVNLRLNRPVAIKTLKAGVYATRAERARFVREGRALAALRDPHVVPVYEAGEYAAQPYFTMELVAGGSLAARLGGAPLPAVEAARITEAIASAVHAAHEAGIIHRDLKPANILLDADGTPKVSDFGLVQSSDAATAGQSLLTLTGQRLGTPSYMAPEQASPRWGAVGPGTDIYGIGAILYETLTGRPPFRGDSPAETERQLLADDPVPPRRLNPRIPRDLETVCLKCLAKNPARRYASAAAVMDELQRFREGHPIRARRAGPTERLVRWVRRRPTSAVAASLALVILVAGVSACVWATSIRAAIARAVNDDLRDVVAQQQDSQWDAADAAINRAAGRLDHVLAPAELRARLDRARQDQALVRRLDAIRIRRAVPELAPVTVAGIANEYAMAFREAALGDPTQPTTAVAQRVRESAIRQALVAALDDWSGYEQEPQLNWVLSVAKLADPDPTGWRQRARDPSAWASRANASSLLNDPNADGQPASVMLMLSMRLTGSDDKNDLVVPMLKKVQQAHPADFWANLYLGMSYLLRGHQTGSRTDLMESVRFLQAAVTLRPDSAPARYNMGVALTQIGSERDVEAIAELEESVRLEPTGHNARSMLGLALARRARHDEAIGQFDAAAQLAPADADIQTFRARSLRALGRLTEALAAYDHALAAKPGDKMILDERKLTLRRLGSLDACCDAWRDLLKQHPSENPWDWHQYPELCLFLGRADDYAAVRRELLDRFGSSSNPRVLEHVGRACLLAPLTGTDLQRATAATENALASVQGETAWMRPYFQFARALADYRAGNFTVASDVCDELPSHVLGPCPKLVAAMAYARMNQPQDARRAFVEGIRKFDWTLQPPPPEASDVWMYHVLRREAESLVLPDLPAFLDGRYFPTDNDERIAMTGACQAAGRSVAGARLWAAVFDDDPASQPLYRGLAIRAAALAGCGRGADADALSDDDRRMWRDRARQWLAAELAAAAEAPPTTRPTTPPEQRATAARATLAGMLKSPDLAGIRDPSLLQQLPADERAAWTDLWQRVGTAADVQ